MIESTKEVQSNSPSRILYLDILRIAACFAVIIIHTSTMIHYYDLLGTRNWWIAVSLNSFTRWSVPIFFMISGATLLDYRKRYSTVKFFEKRFIKIVIPFIFWTGIYLIWGYSIGYLKISGIRDILQFTLGGPVYFHMWFFYSYIGIILVTPILSIITESGNKLSIAALIFLCLVKNQVLPLIYKFWNIPFGFDIPLATSYIDYYLLGWLMKDICFSKKWRWGLTLAGIPCIFITLFGSYYLSFHQQTTDFYLMNYETLTTLFSTLMVFVWVKSINWDSRINGKTRIIIKNIADLSFGIYLIHILARFFVMKYLGISEISLRFLFGGPVIVFSLSALIIFIIKKIPIVRNIIP